LGLGAILRKRDIAHGMSKFDDLRSETPLSYHYNIQLAAPTLLHPDVPERVEALRSEFQSAEPFRHVVIDEFLSAEFCRELMAEFPAFDAAHARNELGQVGGKAVFQNLARLGPAYARLDRMLRSREFLSLTGRITGIPDLKYDPEYVGGGTHENLSGQELDPHVDFNFHPRTHLHRRLNLIVFLNPLWREEWGGALELHVNPWLPTEEDRIKTVLPVANRAVIFETTENSWHGFKKIQLPAEEGVRRESGGTVEPGALGAPGAAVDLPESRGVPTSRRSIAVYFYTKTRPLEESAAAHATVYVPRGLPDNIRAGCVLREEDVGALRTLLDRRDGQIRFLYEREREFSELLAGSKSFRVYLAMTSPARACLRWLKRRVQRP
jgi:Rps23 Pro-64 3,4-dihydroxylase Tpa1-like proline 4-hydroxylase